MVRPDNPPALAFNRGIGGEGGAGAAGCVRGPRRGLAPIRAAPPHPCVALPPLAIRPAQAGEARRIAEIHVRGWQWAYRGLIPASLLEGLSVEDRAAYWRRELGEGRQGNRHVWCAARGVDTLGFAAIGPSRD